MPIEAVKIPQNIYVEDRIIGPISLRQIIITLMGGGISYAIFATVQANGANPVLMGAAWIPAILAIAFAFVSVNGISLLRILLLSLEMLDKPRIRRWEPRRGIIINFSVSTNKQKKADKTEDVLKKKQTDRAQHLENLTTILDRGPEDIVDIEEEQEVNPSDVSVSKMEQTNNIDGMAPEKKTNTKKPTNKNVIRDIHPPA